MLPPQTRSSHKTQVQQRHKHQEHGVDQVPLPPNLQKVEPLHVSNEQPKRNKSQEKQERRESCSRFRSPDALQENHQEENYSKSGQKFGGGLVKGLLYSIRGYLKKTPLPVSSHCQGGDQPQLKRNAQDVRRPFKVESGTYEEGGKQLRPKNRCRQVGGHQPQGPALP